MDRLGELRRRLSLLALASPLGEGVGLLIGTVAICLVGVLALFLVHSGGPTVVVHGQITGFALAESDEGAIPYAHIAVDDRGAMVALPRGHHCRRWQVIELQRRKGLIGYRYSLGPRECLM